MRAILVLFLTSSLLNEGWEWEREDALVLYGWYTGLAYFTPLIGGIIADKLLGYRNATVIGAIIMAIGHGSMALEYFDDFFFFIGIGLIIIGNGLFKPNISSMVGQLYRESDIRKDGAYTIFYMGINCGAFLGILLCGYLGETIGWHLGFGVAGIFMLFGMLQFYFAQNIFGSIGRKPEKKLNKVKEMKNDSSINSIEMDRILVILVFSAATIFFWWAFEQAGGSMTIFANDYTNRNLTGQASLIFKAVNTLITIVPMLVITFVLIKLFQNIFQKYFLSILFLGTSFIVIWGIILFMLGLLPSFVSSLLSSYLDIFEYYIPFNWSASEVVDTEIPASWFSVLNSLFIIIFAPIFSMLWS